MTQEEPKEPVPHMQSSWGKLTAHLGRLDVGERTTALAAAANTPPTKKQDGSCESNTGFGRVIGYHAQSPGLGFYHYKIN